MASSIRQQIIEDIAIACSGIQTAAGYNTDIGANVRIGVKDVDPGDLPVLVIFPGTEDGERNAYGIYRMKMSLSLESVCAIDDGDNPSELCEVMLSDVLSLMLSWPKSISQDVKDILYLSGGPSEWPVAEAKTMGIRAEFQIIYDIITPYQQPISNRPRSVDTAGCGDYAEAIKE